MGVEEWCELINEFEVISPNLLELQYILNIDPHQTEGLSEKQSTEEAANTLHSHLSRLCSISGKAIPTIIVRVGKYGCYSISKEWRGWTPAYWTEKDQGRVVDPTGGGNGFLGGFGAGMIVSGDDARIGKSIVLIKRRGEGFVAD